MHSFVSSLFKHCEEGGWGLYPIFVLAGCMLWSAARQLVRLWRAQRHVQIAVPSALISLRASHDVGHALGTLAALGSTLARSVAAGLAQLTTSSDAVHVIAHAKRNADLAVLDRRARALPMIGGLSALFGLLGTVTGYAQSGCHGCCANADAASRATMLAKGISESMNCLAFALLLTVICVAIDALLEGWRLRVRADVDHALALLDAEVDALRPHLSFYGTRIADARHGYRGV